jgi:hypothetical protein
MSDVRPAIIATYAEWTAMSALRSGAPIKSRRDVYTALRGGLSGALRACAWPRSTAPPSRRGMPTPFRPWWSGSRD